MDRQSLTDRINEKKAQRGAVILAHNYQLGEIQDVADHVGDSLELSRIAAKTEAEVIVFCGVRFMAETAHILAPEKTVLLPDPGAMCQMAAMIDGEGLRRFKAEHADAYVVCYVNSTADIKAQSDICCTSANAVEIIRQAPTEEVIFVPDQNLGDYAAGMTGRKVHLWPGYCLSHVRILPEDILRRRSEFPGAPVVVHPETSAPVRALADHIVSTGGMVRFARETDATQVIIATEIGILHRLEKENPSVAFIAASEAAICPNMKITSLESLLESLETMAQVVTVDPAVRDRAARAVQRMVEVG